MIDPRTTIHVLSLCRIPHRDLSMYFGLHTAQTFGARSSHSRRVVEGSDGCRYIMDRSLGTEVDHNIPSTPVSMQLSSLGVVSTAADI